MKIKKVKALDLAKFVKDAIASGASVKFKVDERRGANTYIRSCHRKVKYGRQETALRACKDMFAKGAGDLEAYECRFCGKWHIGHRNEISDLIKALEKLTTSTLAEGRDPL